ncbi:MAG: hypothetical protein AMK75_02290 [Planctomycetes bacterium SM23_65]|nr:MAG: hypothetical protein AMK75_02290 [Planctomycetes bacterium SM23_65]
MSRNRGDSKLLLLPALILGCVIGIVLGLLAKRTEKTHLVMGGSFGATTSGDSLNCSWASDQHGTFRVLVFSYVADGEKKRMDSFNKGTPAPRPKTSWRMTRNMVYDYEGSGLWLDRRKVKLPETPVAYFLSDEIGVQQMLLTEEQAREVELLVDQDRRQPEDMLSFVKSVILPAVEAGETSPIEEISFEDYIPLSKVVDAFPFDGLFGRDMWPQSGSGSTQTDTTGRRPHADGEHTKTVQPRDDKSLSADEMLGRLEVFPKTWLEPLEVRVVNPGKTRKDDGSYVRRIDYETTWTDGEIVIKLTPDEAGRKAEYTIKFKEQAK